MAVNNKAQGSGLRAEGLRPKGDLGRIGVLMGGPSSERDISIKSGRAVYDALLGMNLDAIALDITTDSRKENIKFLSAQNIDCAFLALHGRFGEDGQIQNILGSLKIPYTGSGPKASKLAMDKIASRKVFKEARLSVPRYSIIENKSSRLNIDNLAFPLVVKPASQGSSLGLSIIDTKKHLDSALDFAFGYDNRVIVEEFIGGRELTIGILEESALPIIEIIPKNKFFDFDAKYHSGSTEYIVPAKLDRLISKQASSAALSAHRLLGCFGCSRVDIILDEDNTPFILEVNTIPGFTSTSLLPKAAKANGLEFNELCLKLLKLAYEK